MLTFRNATIQDLSSLTTIEESAFSYNRLQRKNFKYLIEKGNASLILACKKNARELEPVGYALIFYRKNSSKARLYSLAISSQFRGHGYGQLFLKKLEQIVLDNNKIELRLEVKEDNLAALSLYIKSAYNIFKEIEKYYDDGAKALCLRKVLVR